MPLTVVVGGQYGSEAKAKAVVHLAKRSNQPTMGIRCGGPNAGHTVYFGDTKKVLRLIPSCVAIPDAKLIIAAGALVNPSLLAAEIREIEELGVPVRNRLIIDKEVVAVTPDLIKAEMVNHLGEEIGSTVTGTGSTRSARCMRDAVRLSEYLYESPNQHYNFLRDLIGETVKELFVAIQSRRINIIVEGTQGYGLDMFHSGHYPHITSTSTTAAAFIAEAGIPPTKVDAVCMVVRTYPIRVGGNSGWMKDEITWEEVKRRCGATQDLVEMTSVTKKVRRVGEWDWDLIHHACAHNDPSFVAVHGLDYLDWNDRGVRDAKKLSVKSQKFIDQFVEETRVPVAMAFTGPLQDDICDLI